jgi:Lipopolysaccharide biosynthesis proteins, LPS:glycosyltransferases
MIPILYCGNENVFDGMLISLLSITKYTKTPLSVFVLTMDLTDMNEKWRPVRREQTDYLEKVIQSVNPDSTIRLEDVTDLFRVQMSGSPNLDTSYGPYTLVRLFADEVPGIPGTILYLDTDTIAHDDITPVFLTDMTGCEYAAAIDYLGKIFIRWDYQNAGVLLLNMAFAKQNGFFARARECCRTEKMAFPDQTAMNKCRTGKKFLPSKYNEQRRLHKNTVIQHFCKSIRLFPFYRTVNVKPWEIERMHEVYHIHEYDDILKKYTACKKQLTGK